MFSYIASRATLIQCCIHLQNPASALSESFPPAFIISLPRLCNSFLWRRKGAPKFKFCLFYESLFPSSVFRKLKLITKTQPITLFHITGVTPAVREKLLEWELASRILLMIITVFIVHHPLYLSSPLFFLYKLILFSSLCSPFEHF